MPTENITNESTKNEKESTIRTICKNIAKGSTMGGIEVALIQPFWVTKTKIQNGEKLTLNPKALYRGVSLNLATTVPVVGIQVATAMGLKKWMEKQGSSNKPAPIQSLTCAFLGGATSALVSTGTELVMSHMKENRGFLQTFKWMQAKHGNSVLFKGFFGTACRDGKFAIGLMEAPPYVEKEMNKILPQYQAYSKFGAGAVSGIFAAVMSQPYDTIKTRQQKEFHLKNSFFKTGGEIIKKEGFFALFKGLTPRMGMLATSITVMDAVSRKWDDKMRKMK